MVRFYSSRFSVGPVSSDTPAHWVFNWALEVIGVDIVIFGGPICVDPCMGEETHLL